MGIALEERAGEEFCFVLFRACLLLLVGYTSYGVHSVDSLLPSFSHRSNRMIQGPKKCLTLHPVMGSALSLTVFAMLVQSDSKFVVELLQQ